MCTTKRDVTKCHVCFYVLNTTFQPTIMCEGYKKDGRCTGVHYPTSVEYTTTNDRCPTCIANKKKDKK
ncbi:hypothetical protein HZ326_1254 [Fusarium oxysporum f. sp. albedinis]|nr:hypothetical protein HZ326_1254 [Fusarium oxysporum f. sp. albedinis]